MLPPFYRALGFDRAAVALAPGVAPLAIECAKALLNADLPAEVLAFADALAPHVRSHGRLRLQRAMASVAKIVRHR